MGKIRLMPEQLANKIAAGEVVERPASVIKELVENSLDANSTWLKIELEEAGLSSIKVTDNGDGMEEDDCEQAFFRHATSKIMSENDLFHVRTLGFRGEALASIAAVSKLTIMSSTGQFAGTELYLEGGRIKEKRKSDARKGTTIIIQDLFYNTPARLKYMKTIHTELGHITDLLNRIALSNPNVRIECSHNGRQLFQTNGRGQLVEVAAKIYGISTAQKMIPIHHETLDFSIRGWIAKPEITRASRNYISTFINGRYIKNYGLNRAIIEGYHTLLPIGRYPLAILHIEMDPILVDVNVHPAKWEVRFSKEKDLYEAVEYAVREAFRRETLIPNIQKKEKKKDMSKQTSLDFSAPRYTPSHPISDQPTNDKEVEFLIKEKKLEEERLFESQPAIRSNQDKIDLNLPDVSTDHDDKQLSGEIKTRVPKLFPIGQLHGTYILAQNDQGLYIIDQHAAQERVKYEFYKEKIGEVEHEVQELIVPLTFDLSSQESMFVSNHLSLFEEVGLFIEPFGSNSFMVRSHPTWFPKGEEETVIQDIIEQVLETESTNIHKLREDTAILMSCKRSIKANHHLTHSDMERLLDDLSQTTDPFTCPHGRPIIIHYSTYELEKLFKRVM
ncbi:DNA mismatch repair endonuclease MutL [Bacillaceae bacterium S4-13-56]